MYIVEIPDHNSEGGRLERENKTGLCGKGSEISHKILWQPG